MRFREREEEIERKRERKRLRERKEDIERKREVINSFMHQGF